MELYSPKTSKDVNREYVDWYRFLWICGYVRTLYTRTVFHHCLIFCVYTVSFVKRELYLSWISVNHWNFQTDCCICKNLWFDAIEEKKSINNQVLLKKITFKLTHSWKNATKFTNNFFSLDFIACNTFS